MKGEDIVKYIREEGIKWWGNFNGMEKTTQVRRITEWNRIGMRSIGPLKIYGGMTC
jgi:hypothetical protein